MNDNIEQLFFHDNTEFEDFWNEKPKKKVIKKEKHDDHNFILNAPSKNTIPLKSTSDETEENILLGVSAVLFLIVFVGGMMMYTQWYFNKG